MMSQELFNELMKKIAYLDDALKDARKTNERLTEIKREDNRKIVENLESKRKYWQDKFNKLKEETSHAN
jgi:vacuolar-type H+-ATPase subunit H